MEKMMIKKRNLLKTLGTGILFVFMIHMPTQALAWGDGDEADIDVDKVEKFLSGIIESRTEWWISNRGTKEKKIELKELDLIGIHQLSSTTAVVYFRAVMIDEKILKSTASMLYFVDDGWYITSISIGQSSTKGYFKIE